MVTPSAAAPRRRLGAWLLLLALLWAGGTPWLFSDGALSVYVDMVVLYVGAGLLGAAALATLIVGGSLAGQTKPIGWRRWAPLAATAVVVAVVPSLCRYGAPLSIRLTWSEPALLAASRDDSRGAHPAARTATSVVWIGAFRVWQIDRQAGVTRFTTGACGLAERCGIAHVPQGTPTPTDDLSYKLVRAPWWAFEQR